MTWIVGRTVMVGYAVALSDICVTLGDGTERNCLRKIYPVGRMIALGFAGSVRIGFAMVDRLSALLSAAPAGMGWDPSVVANWWPADAQAVFEESPPEDRALGCHLMLLGAHPNQGTPFPTCYAYRFLSPTFEPQLAPAEQVVSIGSGSTVAHYVEALAGIAEQEDALLQLEAATRGHGGLALGTMSRLTKAIRKHPVSGISNHLHVCLVRRDRIEIGTNDERWIGEPESTHFVMPPVANSMGEFEQTLHEAGLCSTGVSC